MTSLILLDLPPASFCAIDLSSFTTSPQFRGIKNIPPGIHFCYFSPTSDPQETSDGPSSRVIDLDDPTSVQTHPSTSSLHFRTGFFFAASPTTPHIIKKWCPKTEALLNESQISAQEIENIRKNMQEIYSNHLSPYDKIQVPEDKVNVWNTLSSPISASKNTLSRVLGTHWSCESTRETTWERDELDEAIRSKTEISGKRRFGPEKPPDYDDMMNGGKGTLNYTRIDLKRTWPPNAMGRERTVWARDRSWVLTNIFRRLSPGYLDNDTADTESKATANSTAESLGHLLPFSETTREGQAALLAELAISFVATVLLANYSSTIQFKHILEISLTAGEAVKSHTGYFTKLTGAIEGMLKAAKLVSGENAESDDEDEDDEEITGIPIEDSVLEDFVSGGDSWLIKLLRGFNRELSDEETSPEQLKDSKELVKLKDSFIRLKKVCKRFKWYLDDEYVRKGMVDLPAEEGGGRVELELDDLEGEDERGEFAPVIVEL